MTLHPLQYTLSHRLQATHPSPSLFIQSLISFHQVCLLAFSHPHLSTQLDTTFVSKPNPFFPPILYLCLCSSSHLCLLSIILSLLPLFSSSFSTDYLSHYRFYLPPFLNILSLLKSSPSSFSVSYYLLSLQLPSLLALFFFSSSFPRWPLTLYFLLAVLSPLFSFRSPFLLHSGCRVFVEAQPPVGYPAGERPEKQTVGQKEGGEMYSKGLKRRKT